MVVSLGFGQPIFKPEVHYLSLNGYPQFLFENGITPLFRPGTADYINKHLMIKSPV